MFVSCSGHNEADVDGDHFPLGRFREFSSKSCLSSSVKWTEIHGILRGTERAPQACLHMFSILQDSLEFMD